MKIKVTFHYDAERPDAEDPSGMSEEEFEDLNDRVAEIGGYDIDIARVAELFDQERSAGPDKDERKRQEDGMTHHKATVYQDDKGEWRWRVQAANNEIVSEGEGYDERAGAVVGLYGAHHEFAGMDLTSTDTATVELA